ncbi:MAG: hypothetical protein Fur0032_12410 [Terrimicrobiaceae bacterium]
MTRIEAIVAQMGLLPHHQVLEVGCGHGVTAGLICHQLHHGHLVAIDRSEKMIAAAMKRNATDVESGRADFLVADVKDYQPGQRRFDLILAIRVGFFHREPKQARSLVTPWLRPGGRLVSIYDQPTSAALDPGGDGVLAIHRCAGVMKAGGVARARCSQARVEGPGNVCGGENSLNDRGC